jgi:hypothetical protein
MSIISADDWDAIQFAIEDWQEARRLVLNQPPEPLDKPLSPERRAALTQLGKAEDRLFKLKV